MARALERLLRRRRRGNAIFCRVLLCLCAVTLVIALPRLVASFRAFGAFLQYAFIRRAFIGGVVIALCASLLGVILVLKQYSMIGDGLSHVGFGALTIAYALAAVTTDTLPDTLPSGLRNGIATLCASIAAEPLPFTLVIVVVCAIALLARGGRVRGGDASIAILPTGALAVGVIVSSTVKGLNIDVTNAMFGSILAMGETDVKLSVALSLMVLAVFILLYPRIFAVTFDEPFAQATGINARGVNLMISVLTAVTVVVGMRIMGTMLISSLIILPAVTAMHLFSRFRSVMLASAILSVLCFALGLMLSCLCSLPAGAGIVIVDLAADALFTIIEGARS